MNKILLTACAALVLSLNPAFADGHVGKAIDAAKAAQKKAASVDGEWRDTGKMIKQAEELASEGKADEAIELAKKAQLQGEAGYEQAMGQKDAAPRF